MLSIPLTQGKVAIVDDEDFKNLSQWKWSYDSTGYARRVVQKESKQTKVYMHRVVNKTPSGYSTDHINGDKLDNRKSNLRSCSHMENARNKTKQANNSSGFIGVAKSGSKWRAYSGKRENVKHLGVFSTPEEAAKVRDRYALKVFGEFVKLNFRKELYVQLH